MSSKTFDRLFFSRDQSMLQELCYNTLSIGPAKVNKINFLRALLYHQTYTSIGFRCSGAGLDRFYR